MSVRNAIGTGVQSIESKWLHWQKVDIVVKGYTQLDESMIYCVLCDAYLAARNSITRVINVAQRYSSARV